MGYHKDQRWLVPLGNKVAVPLNKLMQPWSLQPAEQVTA